MHRSSVLQKASDYLRGLFLTEHSKGNIERMAEKTQSNYQQQQHFVTDSPWSARDVMGTVGEKCQQRLGSPSEQAYSIDESSNRKAGKHSVGVASQYNGNLGKVENSQTGVYASLGRGNQVGLINARLFLPEQWVNDAERCDRAGVPKQDQVSKTKIELALEMIEEDLNRGIQFGWVNADGLYGNSSLFCNSIEDWGQNFVVDIHKDQHVYLQAPKLYVPTSAGRGRKPTKLITDDLTIKVEDYLQQLHKHDFTKCKIRKGTKGWIKGYIHTVRVWVWDGKEEKSRQRTLIIRKSAGNQAPKFAFSNLDVKEKTAQQFAFMQSQRYWIERAFQDCKSTLGMADYQVRKYRAWYHHQALFMMAYDYVNHTKHKQRENIPLLSVSDMRLLIIAYLSGDGVAMEKEISDLLTRHQQRLKDIIRHYPQNDYF